MGDESNTNGLQDSGRELVASIPSNEATRTSLDAPSDQSLRVPCYCEENVYRLLHRKLHSTNKTNLNQSPSSSYYAVFISSKSQCVPMFHQLAAKTLTSPCFWDYHVVLLEVGADSGDSQIWDMDSRLSFPCPLLDYLERAFPQGPGLPEEYVPLFRIVRGDVYLKHFFSDRTHMLLPDGTYSATPPTYACIQTGEGTNLDSYRIMEQADNSQDASEKEPLGVVWSLQRLRQGFG